MSLIYLSIVLLRRCINVHGKTFKLNICFTLLKDCVKTIEYNRNVTYDEQQITQYDCQQYCKHDNGDTLFAQVSCWIKLFASHQTSSSYKTSYQLTFYILIIINLTWE